MKLRYFLSLFTLLIVLVACKDDVKEEPQAEETEAKEPADPNNPTLILKGDQPRELTEAEKKKTASIMSKLMMTKECSTFSSYLVTVGLTDTLFYEEGPFTVFAPSVEAFENSSNDFNQGLTQAEKLDQLRNVIKSHIVRGSQNSVLLNQRLKAGTVTLMSLSGAKLLVTKSGNDLIVQDEKGNKATIGKSDITGNNGVLHVIDAVLAND